ncbi:MAG: alkaline phosphatase family protein, partial [Planctomycetota bacterium]|nr:alkaline phosphatase family protein [Planctomycetota bacterium]
MTHPTVVINVVGLSGSLIGEATVNINRLIARGSMRRVIPVLPAVTCSVQSSMLTGLRPNQHGIVGNGWYNRELNEVHFWKQSNRLVHGEKVWETARRRDPSVTCANMFWWFNMYGTVDYSVTPRPIYKADGRKIPDILSHPPQLRPMLQDTLGRFPLFNFWGPASSIKSSQWIAEASMLVHDRYRPTLMLIYLPHLDYGLQKLGPADPKIPDEVRTIDRVVGRLIDYFDSKGVRIVLLSEYGIEEVDDSVHINRSLREAGAVAVREEQGLELLDPGASDAFAVADHQIAHVYVKDPSQAARYAQLC